MKDFLLDLLAHTSSLGCISLIKVDGSDKGTKVSSFSDDKTILFSGKFNQPVADFDGVFGLPNLSTLKTIIGFDEYDEKAKITVIRTKKDNVEIPTTIHFETSTGDFLNDYRLMSKALVEEQIQNFEFNDGKGPSYDITFVPSAISIQRMKKQATANSEENHFSFALSKGDLRVFFGDPSTHSGNFVFEPAVNGKLTRPWMWPVKVFLSIMDLSGDKVLHISDQGLAQITVDSGLAQYTYQLPGQAK